MKKYLLHYKKKMPYYSFDDFYKWNRDEFCISANVYR